MTGAPDDLLARLAAEPGEAGLFLDFDGVLAPIVDRPKDAAPPPETRAELARLVGRYALVAVVSGRTSEDVRTRLGVDGLVCVGSHKGTAVRRLLEEHELRRALAAGDDTTDLDSFAALDGLDVAVRVAVTSPEAPGALLDAADLVVADTAAFLALLRRL